MANTDTPREWTVMVYMAASDSHQLDTAAIRDIKEMERGANENVNVVVQINRHWPKSAQLYEIQNDASLFKKQLPGVTDMGEEKTLSGFLTWAVKNYPAKQYFLVLWGHAYGLGFGRDHNQPLTLKGLKGALKAFQTERKNLPQELWGEAEGQLEIFGANACAMSYLEAAYELRDSAQYLVASQISVPFSGWPYEAILARITPGTKARDLGTVVVDLYVSQFNDLPGGDRLAMTLLELKCVTPLGGLLETLATAIDKDVNGNGFNADRLGFFRDVFIGAAAGDVRPLIDLTDLCDDLSGDAIDPIPGAVGDAARALRDAVSPRSNEAVPAGLSIATSIEAQSPITKTGLIVHYRRHPELEDLNGVGIFAPFVTDQETLKRLELASDDPESSKRRQEKQKLGRDAYAGLDLFLADAGGYGAPGEKGTWPGLVYDTLRRDIPADLMEAIDGIGSMAQGDRADVAQIILSIDSSLNKLDRALGNAKRDIVATLTNGNGHVKTKEARDFGPPWLRLVQPLDLQAKVATLKQAAEFHALTGTKPKPPETQTGASSDLPAYVVNAFVTQFRRIEQAVADVERTTKRGLTHARFGLGPSNPTKINLGLEPPKGGEGLEPPKGGEGLEPPKGGEGLEPRANGITFVSASGDLRGDLAIARVADLFRQVGQSLAQLEQATTDVERGARNMLVDSTEAERSSKYFFAATAHEVQRAFHLLEEASTAARRTVRRVLAHPVYGVGPGGKDDLSLDVRQELASRGGMDKRHLRLL